ncbi:translocation/assembly module TamB domain-containing protein, partial [Aetokthonos hydrillicola]|uniref:translocation/assembly module TamB domain-containing protein n=1 Tax=Aetokthonos hydrillicola TaxID=1550245 RepID=UPI001ABAD105
MTKSNQDNHSKPFFKNSRALILRRGGIAVGGLFLVGLAGGAWRLWAFVHKELAPLAENSLTTTLNRPVQVGKVTGFSLTGVKFGASSIPPTATDPEKATVDAVEASFNPLQLLFNRTLKLDVTLVNPEIYLQQNQQGRWFTTTFAPQGKPGVIKTELDHIRFRNAKAIVVPQRRVGALEQGAAPPGNSKFKIRLEKFATEGNPPGNFSQNSKVGEILAGEANSSQTALGYPVVFTGLNGTAQLLNNYQQIKFDLAGLPANGGNVSVKGDAYIKTLEMNLEVHARDFLASDVTHIIKLPVNLQAGRVQGDLNVQLKSWSPKLQTWQNTSVNGSSVAQGVRLQIPRLPQPFINSQANVSFSGTKIQLDNVTTSYGKIPLVASGTVDTKAGLNLAARVNAVSVENAADTLNLKFPVPVTGEAKADLQVVGSTTQPVLLGTVVSTRPARIDKIPVSSFFSKFDFYTAASVINLKNIQAKPAVGGEVTGDGKISLIEFPQQPPQLDFNLTGKNVPGDAIASLYNIKTPFQIGTVVGTAKVTGPTSRSQTVVKLQAPSATYPTNGKLTILAPQNQGLLFRDVAFNVGGGTLEGSGSWANQRWDAIADASGIQVERFVNSSQLQNISLQDARFNGRFALSGTSAPFTVATIRPENARVNVAGGTLAVSSLQWKDQDFAVGLVANAIQPKLLLKQAPPTLNGALNGTFQVAGNTSALSPKTVRATGKANLTVGNGSVTASNIQVADGRYQAQVQANDLNVRQLAAQLPPQVQGTRLNGQFNVAGSVESFQPQTIQASGQARLNNFANGTITASNIQLANGRYQADVNASSVELNQFSPQLQGKFGGKVQVAGTVEQQNLASLLENLRANGQVDFSEGLAGLEQPLTAAINWDGEKLNIERASARDLNAKGYVAAKITDNTPEITEVNLDVQARNYNLQKLPIKLNSALALAGKADFSGQVKGKLPLPNVQGQLTLRDLVVNKLAFEPVLSGPVESVQGQGTSVNLTGTRDRIAASLNGANQPNSLSVKWKDALATGQAQGDNLGVSINNFPLAVLNIPVPPIPYLGSGTVAGTFNGELQVNTRTYAATGNVAIAQPRIGRINGDRASAQFSYDNGTAKLISSEFDRGNSRYALSGTFAQTAKGPQIQAQANVTQGQIQDILTALQFFDVQDFQRGMAAPTYGTAADLNTTPRRISPNLPIFTQLEDFKVIEERLAKDQQQKHDSSYIPNLADLTGTFNAAISLDTATPNGLTANFNVNGQNFVWGKQDQPDRLYKAQEIIAQGTYQKGVLTLLPLRIDSNLGRIAFTGNIGSTEQSGQLRINNFPLQTLNNFVKLPVGVTGNLNAIASVAGSIKNPQAKGELQVTDATLNQKPLQSATASFGYNDGRLNFGSNILVSGAEPVTLTGSIPYKLPFASVASASDGINLNVDVKNQGLGVLNLLNNQVAFESGNGAVSLAVDGTMNQPQVKGIANLSNATFTAQALPGKLTNVTANVLFNLDQINVQNFQGTFNKGQIQAQGNIPIFDNSPTQLGSPLTVNLDKLSVNLKTLYKGSVDGNLQITGSALNPVVGGQLQLAKGEVLLPTSTDNANSASSKINYGPTMKQDKQNKPETGNLKGQLSNLELTLGKDVEISLRPIISFKATGALDVNGAFNAPVPEGTITLKGGGVNLFATQFNLANGYSQTATFRASQPRDPDLNVYLSTNLVDTAPPQVRTSPLSSEINDPFVTSFDPITTIRVDAKVNGPASQLNENLELTSSPTRSKAEIVALLGGTFLETLGGGNESTLGLVNIAGSALNVQRTFSQIGNALGLSDVRI